jgi:hypothetical protein
MQAKETTAASTIKKTATPVKGQLRKFLLKEVKNIAKNS